MLPESLQEQLNHLAEGISLQTLRGDAGRISERYRGERIPGQRLLTEEREALAYALTRMPATYGAVEAALGLSLDCTSVRPVSLLDVGSGTGAAVWAADSLLELDRVTCLEREAAMRSTGSRLMSHGSRALQAAEWITADLTTGQLPCHADLVTEAYVLNELSVKDAMTAAEALWQAADRMLLLVEPGTPQTWQLMMKLRLHLQELGANLAAPCACTDRCPVPEGDWCCFTARIQRSRIHRLLKEGDAPFEDEKFTFLAFVKGDCRRAQARVLRHPQAAKGRIGVTLCTPAGIEERIITKQQGELFRRAKKCSAGDNLSLTDE